MNNTRLFKDITISSRQYGSCDGNRSYLCCTMYTGTNVHYIFFDRFEYILYFMLLVTSVIISCILKSVTVDVSDTVNIYHMYLIPVVGCN